MTDNPAISGMIELLTPRHAKGWACDHADPSAPLEVRVRERETLLAQVRLERALPPGGSYEPRDYSFDLEFPALLSRGQLETLTMEVSRLGSAQWRPLACHFKIGGSQHIPPVPPGADWKLPPVHDGISKPFWSSAAEHRPLSPSESYPVFVLGAVRSGTTALCLALSRGTRYRGFPEGHVLDVAIRLINSVNAHFERKDAFIPGRDIASYHLGRIAHARFQDEVIELLRRLAAGYTTPFWFDKTPTYQMIASVPILAYAWPQARFIFMKRRGLENMRSRLRKFNDINFMDKCHDWALIMSGWRTVRDTVPGRYIEVDQRTLADDPEATAAAVGALLALPPSEIEAFAQVLRSERPEATGPSSSIVAGLAELHWSEKQVDVFREKCGAAMEAYGYTYDASYCR